MRKMILWGMLLVGMIQSRAGGLPQSPRREETPQAVTIDQIVTINSHEQLLRLAVVRMATLGNLLEQVTDERSARQAAPLAERCFLEMELIGVRISMLTPPTEEERPRLEQLFELFQQTRGRIERECARLSKSPGLMSPLRAVVEPLYVQVKHVAEARANSVNSTLQALRSQIELYKLQHDDKVPDLRKHGWNVLTRRTTAEGVIDPHGNMGPYMQSAPKNVLNGAAEIVILRGAPKPDFRHEGGNCGWVFDEVSGQIWALDAEGRIFDESREAQADAR